jgi:hypothetical protein
VNTREEIQWLTFANRDIQDLALIAHHRIRQLLPDVVHHIHGPAAPSDRTTADKHQRRVPARVGEITQREIFFFYYMSSTSHQHPRLHPSIRTVVQN